MKQKRQHILVRMQPNGFLKHTWTWILNLWINWICIKDTNKSVVFLAFFYGVTCLHFTAFMCIAAFIRPFFFWLALFVLALFSPPPIHSLYLFNCCLARIYVFSTIASGFLLVVVWMCLPVCDFFFLLLLPYIRHFDGKHKYGCGCGCEQSWNMF